MADAPAQLVKLRKAEAFGVLDNENSGVRHVDANLDDVVGPGCGLERDDLP